MKSVRTLRDLAALAGVSPSTVSRALNNDARISEKTRRRVVAIAIETGYWSTPTRPIGLVIANPLGGIQGDHFFAEVMNSVLAYRGEERPVLVEVTTGTPEAPLPRVLRDRSVSGVIVGGISIAQEFISALELCGIPTVYIGRYTDSPDDLYAVIPNNRRGGQLAADHLVQQGYTNFWFIGGDTSTCTFADRLDGFRDRLRTHGYSVRDAHVIATDLAAAGGFTAIGQLLPYLKGRTGLFCATDWQASGALQALREAGVAVPREVGVVGYSDLELSAHLKPTLTSIRVERSQLGHWACRLLEDRLSGWLTQPVQLVVQPQLVVRGSTVQEVIR